MKTIFNHCILISAFIAISSCSDDSQFSQQTLNEIGNEEILIPNTAILIKEKSLSLSTTSEYLEAEEFAKLLAYSVRDKEVRKFLKEEAGKMFDGDYDILVSQVLNSKIGNVDFSEKIKQSSVNGYAKGKMVFENAIKNSKLNISIPVLIENWVDSMQQPLVAVVVGISEKETELIKAFDSEGRSYLLDAKLEPNVPVIIVGNNERMNIQKDEINLKYLRTSGKTEQANYLRCPDLSAIESWYFGGPEIRFDGVVYNNDFSAAYQAFTKTQHPSRAAASGGYYCLQNLFEWYFDDNHGPDYFIQTWEIDDYGATQKLNVGVTAGKKDVVTGSASYELTYTAEDKKLAGELIHYTSQVPKMIEDSFIRFQIVSI